MFFVPMRGASPHLDMDVTLVASHGLVVRGKHEEECQEDSASCEYGLR